MRLTSCVSKVLLLIASGILAGPASGQSYPTKLVRMIGASGPGSSGDLLARQLAEKLSTQLKQPVIYEHRPGASGLVAMETVARSAPDGHTVWFAATFTPFTAVSKNLKVDPIKELAPITQLTHGNLIATVHPSVPANTLSEFVAYVKANPGKLNFGSIQLIDEIAFELLRVRAGLQVVGVKYKSSAALAQALLSNEIQIVYTGIAPNKGNFDSGRMRPLAVASEQRSPLMPNLPTVGEAGFPGVESGFWYGLLSPVGTPREAIEKLYQGAAEFLKQPELRARLIATDTNPVGSTPEEFASLIKAETAKWARVAKESNLSVD